MKFKVGDRVRAIGKVCGIDLKGKTGTVICVNKDHYDLGVEFDEVFPAGHDCCNRGKKNHCRFGWNNEFELISNNKIVITTDGVETLARLYEGEKVIKSATAKCNPEDTFDFKVGAKLAYDRLMGEEKVEKTPTSKYKFKVGDRVKYTNKLDECRFDEIGTVICIKADECHYGVEFDEMGLGVHNCNGFELVDGHCGTSGNCYWCPTKYLELYTESKEIKEPKKETKAEETLKYNTGDYVRIIDEKHGHGFKIGTIVRLTKGFTDYKATDSVGVHWWVRDDELAPIEWKVVDRKPKKGDYIRLKAKFYSFNKKGDILRVNRLDTNCVYVLCDDHPRDTGYTNPFDWSYGRCQYEVVEPVETTEKSDTKGYKFKVGDKVVGNEKANDRYSITRQGWIGTVTKVEEDCFYAKDSDKWYSDGFNLEYDYFDLADSEKSPKSKYKVGDKVKVIKDTCYHGYKVDGILTLSRDTKEEYQGSRKWEVEEGITWITEDNFELYAEPVKPDLYNGKVVCVDLQGCNECSYTVGKLYQFKDGHFINDNGSQMPPITDIHDFDEWAKFTSSKFIEVKE